MSSAARSIGHAVVAAEALQEPRVVVQGDRAGVGGAERVEQVGDAVSLEHAARPQAGQIEELLPVVRASGRAIERRSTVVGHQRVHAVDGDELLGDRVRRGVVVGRASRGCR